MDYVDELAEKAVKEAVKSLVAKGKPCHGGSVPIEAVSILRKHGHGRISETIACAKIDDAIKRLTEREEFSRSTTAATRLCAGGRASDGS